jgi:GT2 family glycosyltransferase
MKLGLVIASHGRADLLHQVLMHLMAQRRVPDDIVLSVVDPSDIPEIDHTTNVRKVFGGAGLTCQRNRGMSCLVDTMDVIAFIDDDFVVGNDFFLNLEMIFRKDNSIIGVNGEVVADGAHSPGFTFEEGLRLAEQYGGQENSTPITRETGSAYGCNMAFRTASIGSVRFDERLPLYAWQEDLDFCGALRRSGRIVRTNLVWGVHLGTKGGKGSEVRLGYSQIINPAYIARKGNMSWAYASRLATRNFAANLVKSIRPESYVDRRSRLRGNLIGIFHLMIGRLTPEYILEMK